MELADEVKHKKAKTHKGRKVLEDRLPKAIEDPKLSLFINTANSNEILRMVMNDLVNCILIPACHKARLFKKAF
jgi:hypothetical protein